MTVGSTSFDPLIFAILDPEVLKSLQQSGYSQLTVQHGKLSKGLPDLDSHTQLNITTFDYSANITAEIDQADLVISHAGAGTVLEVLRLNKLLIVVANESLMDNHQLELAEKLVSEQYCLAAHADPMSVDLFLSNHVRG